MNVALGQACRGSNATFPALVTVAVHYHQTHGVDGILADGLSIALVAATMWKKAVQLLVVVACICIELLTMGCHIEGELSSMSSIAMCSIQVCGRRGETSLRINGEL